MTSIPTGASLADMAIGPWTDAENDLIVADYFAMLATDLAGRPYNKTEHNRHLLGQIDRSRHSIEYKHRNISAVLKGLGESWITGYLPAFKIQMSLADAVVRWLHRNSEFETPAPHVNAPADTQRTAELVIELPPTLRNHTPPAELEQMQTIAHSFDVAARGERNRALGRAGEERVLARSRARASIQSPSSSIQLASLGIVPDAEHRRGEVRRRRQPAKTAPAPAHRPGLPA